MNQFVGLGDCLGFFAGGKPLTIVQGEFVFFRACKYLRAVDRGDMLPLGHIFTGDIE